MGIFIGSMSGFNVVAVAVAVFVAFLSMVMATGTVRVSVSSKDNEAEKVREQTSTSNDEDELGVVDLGRFDESSEGFKNNRNTKGDEEDGIEECTQNLCANPLNKESNMLAYELARGNRGSEGARMRDNVRRR